MSGFPAMSAWEHNPESAICEDLQAFCKEQSVQIGDLVSHDRTHHLVTLRVRAAKMLRKNGHTLKRIGRFLNRDHSTIIYYLNEYEDPV